MFISEVIYVIFEDLLKKINSKGGNVVRVYTKIQQQRIEHRRWWHIISHNSLVWMLYLPLNHFHSVDRTIVLIFRKKNNASFVFDKSYRILNHVLRLSEFLCSFIILNKIKVKCFISFEKCLQYFQKFAHLRMWIIISELWFVRHNFS